jgi:hypothetical protein
VAALATCRRRLDIVGTSSAIPDRALELKDALHNAVFTATAAGRLDEARHLAARHGALAFLREEADLALEEGIAPDALGGHWDEAVRAGDAFLAGWARAGRPIAPGRGLAPAAMVMIHGLRGDAVGADDWQHTVDELRGPDLAGRATGYGELFAAVVELHHGRSRAAIERLDSYPIDSFYGALLVQWYVALNAEAAVLARHPTAAARITTACKVVAGNPIGTVLAERARVLHDDRTDTLEGLADELDRLGCPYQAARTLCLAGGPAARRGASRMRSLGAAPMGRGRE